VPNEEYGCTHFSRKTHQHNMSFDCRVSWVYVIEMCQLYLGGLTWALSEVVIPD